MMTLPEVSRWVEELIARVIKTENVLGIKPEEKQQKAVEEAKEAVQKEVDDAKTAIDKAGQEGIQAVKQEAESPDTAVVKEAKKVSKKTKK